MGEARAEFAIVAADVGDGRAGRLAARATCRTNSQGWHRTERTDRPRRHCREPVRACCAIGCRATNRDRTREYLAAIDVVRAGGWDGARAFADGPCAGWRCGVQDWHRPNSRGLA